MRFGGRVVDESGAPLAGAAVRVLINGEVRGEPVLTDARGEYRFFEGSCPCDFDFELWVTEAGYEPYTLRLGGRPRMRSGSTMCGCGRLPRCRFCGAAGFSRLQPAGLSMLSAG